MLDIRSDSPVPAVSRLSNFEPRRFAFDGVPCASIEGVLQALKCPDWKMQQEICLLVGLEAKRRGRAYNTWRERGLLWWRSTPIDRFGKEYFDLVTRIYDAVYAQDLSFSLDLSDIGPGELRHTIGLTDMRKTILTEVEMLYQLNRLRLK